MASNSIDDWLDTLLRDQGLRIIHTTGTSGKLSFLPRGSADAPLQLRSGRLSQERIGGSEPRGLDKVPMIVVGSRTMFNGYGAQIGSFVQDLYGGDESLLHTMDPGRMSADVLSLAGRLAAADNRGELGRSQISPAILKRLDQYVEAQKTGPERRARFFDAIFDKLNGQRVMMAGNWGMYYEMLEAGRQRGLKRVFSPESHFVCSGGAKGKDSTRWLSRGHNGVSGYPRNARKLWDERDGIADAQVCGGQLSRSSLDASVRARSPDRPARAAQRHAHWAFRRDRPFLPDALGWRADRR